MANKPTIEDIPPENLEKIFKYLNKKELANCPPVSIRWYQTTININVRC